MLPTNIAYNQVVKDLANALGEVLTDTLYAASRIHLTHTDTAALARMEQTNSSIVFDTDTLLHNPDPRVQRIMQTHMKAFAAMEQLKAYWITTSEWANGEEI